MRSRFTDRIFDAWARKPLTLQFYLLCSRSNSKPRYRGLEFLVIVLLVVGEDLHAECIDDIQFRIRLGIRGFPNFFCD